MSDINWEGLLEMWQEKLAKNLKYLDFVQLPIDESPSVVNLYQPEHCGAKFQGNNMISDDDFVKVVEKKRNAKALLLYSCPKITSAGILSSLKIINTITLLVLDEIKISHEMMVVISENVKTLKVISLFCYPGDVSDESIEAVAKENKEIEWFVLPGFYHATNDWKITSQSVTNLVRNCSSLRKINMPSKIFDDASITSMKECLEPENFELLTVRIGKKNDINFDLLKQLFDNFPKLRAGDLPAHLLRKAGIPQGFEDIEIGKDENMTMMPLASFLQLLNGEKAQFLKKITIPNSQEEVLTALVEKGLHTQIKNIDLHSFGDVLSKKTLVQLAKFTSLESLDLSFCLGENGDLGDDDYVKTNDIVKLLSKMKELKKLDLSWCAISPKGVEKVVKQHPLLVDLKMEGCGGESYDYTDFLMGLEDVACLNRAGLKWSSRNKYGERSGMYQEQARSELEELGMDTGAKIAKRTMVWNGICCDDSGSDDIEDDSESDDDY